MVLSANSGYASCPHTDPLTSPGELSWLVTPPQWTHMDAMQEELLSWTVRQKKQEEIVCGHCLQNKAIFFPFHRVLSFTWRYSDDDDGLTFIFQFFCLRLHTVLHFASYTKYTLTIQFIWWLITSYILQMQIFFNSGDFLFSCSSFFSFSLSLHLLCISSALLGSESSCWFRVIRQCNQEQQPAPNLYPGKQSRSESLPFASITWEERVF